MGCNIRLDEGEEGISELEDRAVEITQSKEQAKKKKE